MDSAQSGPIDSNEDYNEESWIQTIVNGPGELTFWWKVSSEDGFDTLTLFTNGFVALTISGNSGWQQVTRLLEEGPHTLRWRYQKDSIDSWWADTAWLDQVTFGSPAPQPFTLSPNGFSGGLIQISLQGEPDRIYRLYSSSNLLDWVPVQTNSDPSGLVPFSDFATGGDAQRYYRGETDPN
jgi:hypothetical protein